jgi:hypothetical protein
VIKAVLAPDIKLFDARGKFAPDSAAAAKDALSLGVALLRCAHASRPESSAHGVKR